MIKVKNHEPFISVAKGEVHVIRLIKASDVVFNSEKAVNQVDLRDLAMAEVFRQGGSINSNGLFEISKHLADQAVWPEDTKISHGLTAGEKGHILGIIDFMIRRSFKSVVWKTGKIGDTEPPPDIRVSGCLDTTMDDWHARRLIKKGAYTLSHKEVNGATEWHITPDFNALLSLIPTVDARDEEDL